MQSSHLSMPSGEAPIIGRDPLPIHCSNCFENSGRAGIGSLNASKGNIPGYFLCCNSIHELVKQDSGSTMQ